MPDEKPPDSTDKFTDLLTRLAQVPKAEIDEREREHQQNKPDGERAKPGAIADLPKAGRA